MNQTSKNVYIKKLEITSFGKFENHTVEFENGYNELILPNEYGKSTIVDFILFILYGFAKTTSKKVPLLDNLLKKYMPWNGAEYISGAMVLVSEGKEYRIERRQRESGRVLTVLRDITGTELPLEGEPGERFFGIDRETFIRTFLIRQTDIRFYGTDGIKTALKNLVTTGDEDISFEAAEEILKKKKTKYQHGDRRSGRIFDIPKEITALEGDIFTKKQTLALLSSSVADIKVLNEQISELEAKKSEYQEMLPTAKANDAKKILEKVDNVKSELSELEVQLDLHGADSVSEDELTRAEELFAVRSAQAEASARLEREKAELEQKLSEQTNAQAGRRKAFFPSWIRIDIPTFIFGILFAFFGIFMTRSLHSYFKYITYGGVLITVISCFIGKKKLSGNESENTQEDIALTRALIDKNLENQQMLDKEIAATDIACDEIFKKTGATTTNGIAQLRARRSGAALLQKRKDELEQKLSLLLEGRTENELSTLAENAAECPFTVKDLEGMIADISIKRSDIITRVSSISQDASKAKELEREIYLSDIKKSQLESELCDAEYKNRVFDTALSALREAFDKINSVYSPILSEKAKEPMTVMTGGKYSEVYLDKDFEIRIKADGEIHELGYFSRGTADAVYFAMRRAVSDIIAGDKSLPVIMDDPYWSLDSERLLFAREYAKKFADDRQVIVFSAR